ncbi:P-loop NTPase fold protein [Pseudoalteromonas sp. G4]|uniref:P-loop NTPase fold protein n=1 Tax=Pseudoalteromonas sp. G4 TaxID=2992761 RepID=UPI00237D5BB8|nr:P-loop NTPase fold protein [Pseudoalteromonas sp. G4]MDE3274328.1 KAP family NTPase [Pseudoalteromonas sp. G4]
MPSSRQLLNTFIYSIVTITLFSLLSKIDFILGIVDQWSVFHNTLHWSLQIVMLVIAGCLITVLFRGVGSYHLEFIDGKKVTQDGYSVLKASVIFTVFFLALKYKTGIEVLALVKIFVALYFGKILPNLKGYFIYYKNLSVAILKHPNFKAEFNHPNALATNVERPIQTRYQDRFNSILIAEKLKGILIGESSYRRIALYGNFGTGKSSVLNLLEESVLKSQKSSVWVFMHFNAWGKANKNKSIEGILLHEIMYELTKHIETSSIQKIPEHYLAAMKDFHRSTKVISNFISPPTPAEKQLVLLNSLLQEAKLKLCVFIEDIDRNEEPNHAINSMAPLLNKLKDCDHISFIFTLGYTLGASDITSRFIDYREDLPKINFSQEVKAKFIEIRNRPFNANNKLKLFYEKTNQDWGLIENLPLSYSNSIQTVCMKNAFESIGLLVQNLRNFAAIKREVNSKWSKLKGEFNFDDLLILTTLKICTPLAYDFILYHHHKLQLGSSNDYLNDQWEHINFGDLQSHKNSCENLIKYLFPHWSDGKNNGVIRQQSCSIYDPKNYWEVYLQENPCLEFSDQEIYREMLTFNGQNKFSREYIFINKMIGNREFIQFIQSLIIFHSSFDKSSETDYIEFWSSALEVMESKSKPFVQLLTNEKAAHYSKEMVVAESLITVLSKLPKDNEDVFYKHLKWAITTSFKYISIILDHDSLYNLKLRSLFRTVFSEVISTEQLTYKLLDNTEELESLLKCLKLNTLNNGDLEQKDITRIYEYFFNIFNKLNDKDFLYTGYKELLLKYDFHLGLLVPNLEVFSLLNDKHKEQIRKLCFNNDIEENWINKYKIDEELKLSEKETDLNGFRSVETT